ncbi:hypothetical protein [Noviherbaspirillum pedocola]|uniref:Uncharacterized protein n=1 Tax=Noviherbaspirillum pedocola TaxID=2801341 RepID=A0A934SUT2_9BURK|nr:hypothetical protein [Noviherbaspirillum pedocola]MBK4733202.1 hypothetical protein [Noviherbaspirillum pedocola]
MANLVRQELAALEAAPPLQPPLPSLPDNSASSELDRNAMARGALAPVSYAVPIIPSLAIPAMMRGWKASAPRLVFGPVYPQPAGPMAGRDMVVPDSATLPVVPPKRSLGKPVSKGSQPMLWQITTRLETEFRERQRKASSILEQTLAHASAADAAIAQWNRLQPRLSEFLVSYPKFTELAEFKDYIAVVQIAALHMDGLFKNAKGTYAKWLIAEAINGLWACLEKARRQPDGTPGCGEAERRQWLAEIQAALYGYVHGQLQNADALPARFIGLLTEMFDGDLGSKEMREVYGQRFATRISEVLGNKNMRKVSTWHAAGKYREPSCSDLVQAHFDKGGRSAVVSMIRDALALEASALATGIPPTSSDQSSRQAMQLSTTTSTTVTTNAEAVRAHEHSASDAQAADKARDHQANSV